MESKPLGTYGAVRHLGIVVALEGRLLHVAPLRVLLLLPRLALGDVDLVLVVHEPVQLVSCIRQRPDASHEPSAAQLRFHSSVLSSLVSSSEPRRHFAL